MAQQVIDWSKVSTPGAPPSSNPQTTTTAIPPATSDLTQAAPDTQQGPGLGASFGNSTQAGQPAGYETGKGWRPASQAEVDALDPGQRIGRGIDYLGYLLFGNQSDQQGGQQFGHEAPLGAAPFQPIRNLIGLGGEAVHAVATTAVVRPIEIGATVLSHIPLGWLPGGADDTFNELGNWAKTNSPEIRAMWEQTRAMADADVLGGGNMKADFNDEVLRMLDDMQYDSTLGTTPTLYLGRRTVGSFGGAVSHAIEGWLGVLANESSLNLGQMGAFNPDWTTASYDDMKSFYDQRAAGHEPILNIGAPTDAFEYAQQQIAAGKMTEQEARAYVEKSKTQGDRLEEATRRYEAGNEISDVEKKAVEAYLKGAWSKQHAEEWLVSHGQSITRNPVGQIAGTVVTDPLTYATLGLGGVSSLGTTGLKVAEAADVTIQSMKGLSLTERIAASSGNAIRIAKAIPEAESTYQKIAMGIAAVQKSPAGPVARVARGMVDPFGVWKPSAVDKTAIAIKNEVAVGGLARAHGQGTFNELEAIGRETGMTTEIRQAAANYASDQADLMVATEARDQMVNKGYGIEMMDPNSELNNVDNVISPMTANYATRDAQTRLTDHIVGHSRVTFTAEEEANLAHRLGSTLGGGIDWQARVAKMGHDLKSLLHAITYKLTETDWYNAMNAVDRTAYDGDLPLHLGTIMDMNTMDEEMARAAVEDIKSILASDAPDRIELATSEWNNLARRHDRMGNIGYAPGGEKQLQALIREMESDIEQGAFPKTWTESELSHPALQPLRDSLDRHSIPMTPDELAAAKAAAAKTATISRARKAAAEARVAEQRQELEAAVAATQNKAGKAKPGMAKAKAEAQKALDDFNAANPAAEPLPAAPAGTLYHGSPKAGLRAASSRPSTRQFDNATSQFGAFTTPDRAAAERYAGKGGTVYEATGAPKNPYHMPRKEFDRYQAVEKDAAGNALPPDQWAARAEELKAEAAARRAELEAKGYDGIVVAGNKGNPAEIASFSDVALHPEGTAAAVSAAESGVSGVKRLWKVGSRPNEEVAWGLKYDPATGLPTKMREPTISHNFMAYPGKAPFSDTVRNALGQIIGTVPANAIAKPVDSMEAFIKTMQDVVTGRRLVLNMQQRFERSMFDAGVPKPLIRTIFTKAKEVAALEQTTLRGLKASPTGGLWQAIADDIPRDLRLANGQALDVHTVMDHLLVAAEGDLRVMGLTSKFSQRMRNALRTANIDPVNYGGQLTVTQYNKARYALNPTFLIQRMTDSIYYSILYGVTPVGRGALSESNMALQAITENLARTGMARDFAFDLPEFATRANWTAGVKSALQQAGITDSMLSKIANAPDALIQNNMVNLLHARLGNIVRGVLDNLGTAIEKDATLLAGATPEQANILRRSFADWRAVYSKNAGRVLSDDEVGLLYVKDMLSGWRRVGPINPDTGLIDMKGLIHEGAMMLPSDIGAIGSIMPDSLALELGYVGDNAAAAMRKDVAGSMQKIGGTYVHVPGEHDLAWLKEALVNKLGAHPDYVKRALAYFGDTWDNFWYRMSLPLDKGGLDISEHYAKEAQQVIAMLARDRGMDPWEYLSGVMLINSGTDSLDTAIGRFVNFLKKGEVNAEPSDWGAFFKSHLDPSAQTTLMDAYAKAEHAAAEAAAAPKVGEKFIRTEADGRQFQWHVYSYDPKTGRVGITTNPKGVGRLGTMSREEWDAMKSTPAAKAAATPHDVPLQPPLGFVTNPHIVASGHAFPADIPRDGLFHVTTGKDGVMSQGFRGSNAGEAAPAFAELESKDAYYAAGNIDLKNKAASVKAFDALPPEADVWVYHATDEATAQAIAKDGLSQSNMPQNLARQQYAAGEAATYAPGAGVGQGTYVGGTAYGVEGYGKRIIAMRVKKAALEVPPESADSALSLGDALAEHNGALLTHDVPASDIVMLPATGKVPGDSFEELSKAMPTQLQGIGSVGDTLNKGRVSFVTSAVRAQAYHDRLLLAVKAARGEITNAEVADYFIPLYQKAYGAEFAQRMKAALNDAKLLEGSEHTPQELVYMVKRLGDGLIGGSGGVSPGGMKTGLTSAEGAVHLTSKAEQLAKIDPDQIAIINLATREKAVAQKGIDVGELTLPPEDLHPMSVVGESRAQPQSFVDPTQDVAYQQDLAAWQAEQDAIGADQVRFNKEQEQYTYAQLAHENDKINYARDMKQYDRLAKQHVVLQKEYDAVAAENAARDAQHAEAMKQYKADLKTYEAEQKAYDDAVAASEDAMNSDAVPEPVQKVIDRWTDKKKDPTRLRANLEKLADEGYDVQQADSLLDDYVDMEREPGTSMEDFGYEKQDAWDAIMEELAAVPPIEGELPMEPIPPIKPEHPGELPLPPKPIAPVKPVEPVAPTPPKPVMEPKLTKPVPPEPKPLALEQTPPTPAAEPQVPPVDEAKFWDQGIVDMLEKRSKTGPHPNPDVEGALQKVAELTQRVLKDSKGAKSTRTTIRELGKAIPLTNPVPYNRSHVLIQHLVQTKIEDAQRDIFRLVEMQTQRTVLERSLNHPLFGLYPSSYMWGKVLPETIKFLAKNPYAATYVINDVQRAIAIQREYDPDFEDKMNSVDRSAAAFWIDYMTPGLPWSDHSARVSPMVRDLMKGDLINIIPDELNTMSPKRWYDQTLRSLQEIPGAVDTITGGDQQTQQRLQSALGSSFGGGGAVAAPGNATPEQISGAVKAAALAPIIADDLSRLQDILLGGKDAATGN